MPKLCLFFPDAFDDPSWAGKSFCLDVPEGDHGHGRPGEWIVGRHPAADLTLAARTISARHAAINYSYASNRWAVTDLASTNGTRLNGELLPPHDPRPVAIGDRLHLGPNPIHVVENEDDTLDSDDGPSTVVGRTPINTTAPPPAAPEPAQHQPKTVADTLYLGVGWVIAPTTWEGMIYRLIILAIAALVAVLIMGAL